MKGFEEGVGRDFIHITKVTLDSVENGSGKQGWVWGEVKGAQHRITNMFMN